MFTNFQKDEKMKNRQTSQVRNGSATTRRADGALTRRELIGASLLGAGMLGSGATPLIAESRAAAARRQGRRVIDAHVHLWKLPRNAPPMSDNATFPTGCCGSVPWMEVDRLPADYDARVGGPKVVPVDNMTHTLLSLTATRSCFPSPLTSARNVPRVP